jgi:5-formyltetrahydrofolate cyclo-ligase
MEEKRDLRTRVRAARWALPDDVKRASASAVAEAVLAVPGIESARAVLGYISTPEELDPAPLLATLRQRGVRVALPRVDDPGRLTLHWFEDGDTLVRSDFGILEPPADAPAADPAELDLVLMPGVAFDATCNRLGYGGCYYDNLLPLLHPDALTVGLAFDIQLVDDVPIESHDLRPRWVVTPSETYARD